MKRAKISCCNDIKKTAVLSLKQTHKHRESSSWVFLEGGTRRKLQLTLIAEGAEEAGETFTVTGDVVARTVTVDTLRTRLAATLAEETR